MKLLAKLVKVDPTAYGGVTVGQRLKCYVSSKTSDLSKFERFHLDYEVMEQREDGTVFLDNGGHKTTARWCPDFKAIRLWEGVGGFLAPPKLAYVVCLTEDDPRMPGKLHRKPS